MVNFQCTTGSTTKDILAENTGKGCINMASLLITVKPITFSDNSDWTFFRLGKGNRNHGVLDLRIWKKGLSGKLAGW
jgi:hypothetical protein